MLKSLCLKYFNYLLLLGCRKFPFDVAHKTLYVDMSPLTWPCAAVPPHYPHTKALVTLGPFWAPVHVASWAHNVLCAHMAPHLLANLHPLHGSALVSASEKSFRGNSVLLPLPQSLSQLQATLLSPVIFSSCPRPPAPSEAPCLQRLRTYLTEHEHTWLLDIKCRWTPDVGKRAVLTP